MSYAYSADCCPVGDMSEAIMRGIADVNGMNNTSFKVTPAGALVALTDPYNRQGASYQIEGPNGKVERIRVIRQPRGTPSEAVDYVSCDATTTSVFNDDCITVNKAQSVAWNVTIGEMQDARVEALQVINQGGVGPLFRRFLDQIMGKMDSLRQKINQDALLSIYAAKGNNITYNSTAPQPLNMVDAVTGAKIEKGIQDFMHSMTDNEVYGQPLIIGFGNFDKFNTSAKFGCCNAYGLDWNAMDMSAPYRFYKDVTINATLGDPDLFLALAPGTVQLVSYNEAPMMRAVETNGRHGITTFGMLDDPYSGLRFDIAIQEQTCTGGVMDIGWTITLYLHYDFAFVPANAYASGDRLVGSAGTSNGIYTFDALAV